MDKLRTRFDQSKILFFLLGVLTILISSAHASDSPSDEENEYSFNWLDPDKKIYVLQNRKFLKGGRPMISALAGTGFSNPYRNTYNIEPRLSYFMNETWGLEAFYVLTSNSPNPAFNALIQAAPAVGPSVREIRGQFGARLMYIPWYAKINVFNTILHFDWYFAAGAASLQTYVNGSSASTTFLEQDLIGGSFSTGHIFHLSQALVFRLDLTGTVYQAPVNGTAGETAWYSNFNFGVGLGWKI